MLESFALRISVDCRACRISIPLNGIVSSATCYHCGEVNRFDPAFWSKALPAQGFAHVLGNVQVPDAQAGASPAGGPTDFVAYLERLTDDRTISAAALESERLAIGLRVECWRGAPECQQCHRGKVGAERLAEFASRGSCACPECGTQIPVRPADPVCFGINTGARFVVNEQAPSASGQSLQRRTKPVAFQCVSCGAGLRVDGAKRMVGCEFCNVDNYLPDGLWQMLNPVPKPETFFLICEYENAAERAARASAEELVAFAQDPSPEVRRAVAANPATPATVLQKLSFDRERMVLEGLAMNPALPASIVDQMATSDDIEFQLLAVQHPKLSLDQLEKLEHHRDGRVSKVARDRIEWLRSQGVKVGGGFLSKLFR
ncbi:MAG: hypothetical protein HY898_17755 [Deltaproteobacteria bacterium]|nr:hypothetical protein [Deltaproteobacteria bacterium]